MTLSSAVGAGDETASPSKELFDKID